MDNIELTSDGAKQRHQMVAQMEKRLTRLVHRALYLRSMDPKSFVIVCIAVDSRWRPMVDRLMPNHDWDVFRERGEKPVALGIVLREGFCDDLLSALPDLRSSLEGKIPSNFAHAVVLDDSGGTVYDIPAMSDPAN